MSPHFSIVDFSETQKEAAVNFRNLVISYMSGYVSFWPLAGNANSEA